MKKNIKYIIAVIAVVLGFILIYVLYNSLTTHYTAPTSATAADSSAQKESNSGTMTAGDSSAQDESSSGTMTAVDFTVTDMEGNRVTLSDNFGKPIILNFWATWCGPCQSELQSYDELYQEYKDEVQFMMIDLTDGTRDTVDSVTSFVNENGYSFPVYFDTEASAAQAYGVYSIPMTIAIDSDGNISIIYNGALDKETIEEYIKEVQ